MWIWATPSGRPRLGDPVNTNIGGKELLVKNTNNGKMNKKMMIRVYNVNSESDWNKAIGMGANLLATDKVSDNSWAAVSDDSLFAQRSRIS